MLATTLPRQIEMTKDMYSLGVGLERHGGGVGAHGRRRRQHAAGSRSRPTTHRIKFDRLVLREGERQTWSTRSMTRSSSSIRARTDASTCAAATAPASRPCWPRSRPSIKNRAYYWPTTDRLAFQFAEGVEPEDVDEDIDPELLEEAGETPQPKPKPKKKLGFSSGERQLKSLQEIVRFTDALDLSARRMGRQPRHQESRGGRRAGREAGAARPRHRDFPPRPRRRMRRARSAVFAD